MAEYNGWTIVAMPASPLAPASFEFARNGVASANTNPFSGGQQVYDWRAGWWEASVSMPFMSAADEQAWAAFFESLDGPACVFAFSADVCALRPKELTTDGATPRYWRLQKNRVSWIVGKDRWTSVTFEIREAK